MRQLSAALIPAEQSKVPGKLQIAQPVTDVPEEVNYLLVNIWHCYF